MNITKIGVANFRSFDEEGVTFENPQKINLIIGKNNSGKSNFLRFLKIFAENSRNFTHFPSNDIENQFRRNNKNTELIVGFDPESHFTENDYFNNIEEITLKIDLTQGKIVGSTKLDELSTNQLLKLQNRYSSASKEKLIEVIHESLINVVKENIQKRYTNIVYIPHFRKAKSNTLEQNDSKVIHVNGDDVITRMFTMQHPRLGDEKDRQKFDLIQKYVRELINEPSLKIEIPHDKDRIILELHGNRLSLEAFGTGIHELVIMCMAIAIYDDHVVCIEEPEIHLHPELQRKFLEFLQETSNTYFITTHSNVFLDFKSNVNIYHVKYDQHSSQVIHANTNEHSYEILNDLAYKASDLLQSNGIIWVEGPSDRIYLKKWIELMDSDLKEGIHYSIMFYGGRLLAHLTMKSEFFQEELIPLLKINRNAVVMIDRDGFSSKNKLNETKKRINAETKIQNCWITKGREIENYLTERTIKSFFKEEKDVNIKFSHHLDKKLSDHINSKNKNTKFNYSKNKTGFSKTIVKYITQKDLDILDLSLKLSHLEKEINRWNFKEE